MEPGNCPGRHAATTFLAGALLSLLAIGAVMACPAAERNGATGR